MPISWFKHYNLLIFDHIDSTNSEALRLIQSGSIGDFIIVAKNQTAGRGQRGRKWESIAGNLHVSLLLESNLELQRLKELSFLTAITLHKTVNSYIKNFQTDLKLKWPNDVLINGKKLAGILLESIRYNNKNYVIIGIGVNTHFTPKIKNILVTSLLNEGIVLRQEFDFLNKFMINFDSYYKKWQKEGNFTNIKDEWIKNAYNLNDQIVLDNGFQKVTGIFCGIDDEGAICIKQNNGTIECFSAGDVSCRL